MTKVWECKIIIDADDLPSGFDNPPRKAVLKAIEDAGFEVKACFSGWGGSVTQEEQEAMNYVALINATKNQ